MKETGCVYFFGKNANGQLGLKLFDDEESLVYDQDNCTPNPTLLPGFTNITCVSTGAMHSAIIDGDGDLYTFGSGTFGKLGIGNTETFKIPTIVRSGTRFKMVACGNEHTLALTYTGAVFSWGSGSKGRLGLGSDTTYVTPTQVISIVDVQQVYASGASSAAINARNVYTWGYNHYGQLGHGTTKNCDRPLAITMFGGTSSGNIVIRSFSVGDRHMAAVDTDGFLYTWGSNAEYQLGDGTSFSKFVPVKHTKMRTRYNMVCCGGDYTAAISTEDDENALYVWGTFINYTSNTPRRVDTGYSTVSCSCDCSKSILAIKLSGETMACGWSRYGQNGEVADLVDLSPLKQLAGKSSSVHCGAYHSAILFNNNVDVAFQLAKSRQFDAAYTVASKCIKELMEYTNFDGDTFLHILAKQRINTPPPLPGIVDRFINTPNKVGLPPFFYNGIMMNWSNKCNFKFTTSQNQNVLHHYCINKMFNDIDYIIGKGIDERIPDNFDKRPFDYLDKEKSFSLKKTFNLYDIGFVFTSDYISLANKLKGSLEENYITVGMISDDRSIGLKCLTYVLFVSSMSLKHTFTVNMIKNVLSKKSMLSIWAEKTAITDPMLESAIYRSQLVDFSTTDIYKLSLSTLLDGLGNLMVASSQETEKDQEDLKSDSITTQQLSNKESIFLSFNPSKKSEFKPLFDFFEKHKITITPREKGVLPSWVFVVIINSNEFSPLIRDEISLAENRNKPILAIYTDSNIKLDEASRYTFSNSPYLQFNDQGFHQLLNLIKLNFNFQILNK